MEQARHKDALLTVISSFTTWPNYIKPKVADLGQWWLVAWGEGHGWMSGAREQGLVWLAYFCCGRGVIEPQWCVYGVL